MEDYNKQSWIDIITKVKPGETINLKSPLINSTHLSQPANGTVFIVVLMYTRP